MSPQNLDLKISRFWEWFEQSQHIFKDVVDPQAAVEAMDNQVLSFGLFSWEIGEGHTKPHYLLISPNGNGQRLEISYKLMKAAPDLSDWEFRYCKPPVEWDFHFEIYDQFLIQQKIDAAEWEYILDVTPNGLVEVVICITNMKSVDTEDKLNAAETALIKILGEEVVIDNLGALEVVNEFSLEQDKRSQHMRTLKRGFEKLISVEY